MVTTNVATVAAKRPVYGIFSKSNIHDVISTHEYQDAIGIAFPPLEPDLVILLRVLDVERPELITGVNESGIRTRCGACVRCTCEAIS